MPVCDKASGAAVNRRSDLTYINYRRPGIWDNHPTTTLNRPVHQPAPMLRIRTAVRTAAFAALVLLAATGCTSLGKGIASAVMDRFEGKGEADTRACTVTGRAFSGIAGRLAPGAGQGGRKTIKVLMVHGIGVHKPGYAAGLAENLARALQMNVRGERAKTLRMRQDELFPGESLGELRVTRYANSDDSREMQFYELTWSGITEPEKALLDYDSSAEQAHRRATLNHSIKLFSNSHVPDPIIYLGHSRERIQASVGQSLCWVFSSNYDKLPEQGDAYCSPRDPGFLSDLDDSYAFLSHSLGSRVLMDSLERLGGITREFASRYERMRVASAQLREKDFPVYMLSNQLTLLQLGRDRPTVSGQFGAYCEAGGANEKDRMFRRLNIMAFSDPNDILSYSVPPDFVDQYLDSRLCPTMTNVSINIAHVASLFGLGEIANPMTAHAGYENDERVIQLIAYGIGTPETAPVINARCEWLEVR
jgi:hypothetical protein